MGSVLSGPGVEHAWFINKKSFQVSMMELHDLDCLVMKDCKEIQVAGDASLSHCMDDRLRCGAVGCNCDCILASMVGSW